MEVMRKSPRFRMVVGVQRYGVIEEFVKVKNPGYPLAVQKYDVFRFRIPSGGVQVRSPSQQAVVQGRGRGFGHDGVP